MDTKFAGEAEEMRRQIEMKAERLEAAKQKANFEVLLSS